MLASPVGLSEAIHAGSLSVASVSRLSLAGVEAFKMINTIGHNFVLFSLLTCYFKTRCEKRNKLSFQVDNGQALQSCLGGEGGVH